VANFKAKQNLARHRTHLADGIMKWDVLWTEEEGGNQGGFR